MARQETDRLGKVDIPDEALYGIHTVRARDNFPISAYSVDSDFIAAYADVKRACAETNTELGYLDTKIAEAIIRACRDMSQGILNSHIIVDALQGGAGTSTNMNINEVLANQANIHLGGRPGDYHLVNPLDHVNMHQSTNDTYPTALRIASLRKLYRLEKQISLLQETLQNKELSNQHIVKQGRTEMQDAVPMTAGMAFGAWAEAIARDRWRIFKNRERLKTHPLGGTAIGTGMDAPREYIFRVTERIKKITGLVLSRAENMVDVTQNLDVFVEVSGMLKAYATNLMKIANDIRFLSSSPVAEISIPKRQAGSSIMPGKVNPVIPEAVVQTALKVMANDSTISLAAGMGQLELNHLAPLITHAFLESLMLLENITKIFNDLCILGIQTDEKRCRELVEKSVTLATVLVPKLGYKKVEDLVLESGRRNISVREILLERNLMTEEEIDGLLAPELMIKLGY